MIGAREAPEEGVRRQRNVDQARYAIWSETLVTGLKPRAERVGDYCTVGRGMTAGKVCYCYRDDDARYQVAGDRSLPDIKTWAFKIQQKTMRCCGDVP